MIFRISRQEENLPITTTLPPELEAYQVFPSTYHATGPWGCIILQILPAADFVIRYCTYIIKEESFFNIRADTEIFNLYFAYKNNFRFDTTGLGKIKIEEGQFNLSYYPALDATGHFTPGRYESFYISYSKDYLNRFTPYLPQLKKFLDQTADKVAQRLTPQYTYATYEMMAVANSLLEYDHRSGLSTIFAECKALELLTRGIEKLSREQSSITLNRADTPMFDSIRKWLIDYIDYDGTLKELAQQFHTNEFKLKKGFKELYGCTVFEMLFKLRMERASKMLLETQLPVTEIGYRAGYSSVSHFSDAFRKHFGYPPTFLRKK